MTLTWLTSAVLFFVALAGPVGAQQPGAAADPEAKARAFVDLLSTGSFQQAAAQFTPQMAAALPVDRLGATWNGLVTQAGAFQRVVGASSAASGGLSVVALTCEFARATWIVRVTLDGQGRVAGLFLQPAAAPFSYTPPPYAAPARYTEREVTVGTAPWTLPATLTMPIGDGPFPAVVLVHGSGPGDRDETVGKNKPFEDLALGLASRGVAVLRYEKRTRQYAGLLRNAPNFTVKDETIDDAVAAAELLRHESRVDPRRVWVLGHSLGAMLVPRIGAADSQLAGLIVMAGPARPMEQALVDQVRYLAMADGTVTPEEQSQIDQVTAVANRIRSLTPADVKDPSLILGAPASYWLDLRGYDPPAAAARLAQPLLVLQGERDYQVTMDEFATWKTALASKSNATLRSFPALNHLFIAGPGKSLPAEYDSPGHVSEDVVVAIASWIAKP